MASSGGHASGASSWARWSALDDRHLVAGLTVDGRHPLELHLDTLDAAVPSPGS